MLAVPRVSQRLPHLSAHDAAEVGGDLWNATTVMRVMKRLNIAG
jgi:hypothetical protein